MKYLKSFEVLDKYSINNKDYTIFDLKIGYYVKANYGNAMEKEVRDFLDKNIGIIVNINRNKNIFQVEYVNVPENIKEYFDEAGYLRLLFDISGLIEYAPTKEELELKLTYNKYNL